MSSPVALDIHCRADILVYKVVNDGGNIVRQPVYPTFQDFSSLIK